MAQTQPLAPLQHISFTAEDFVGDAANVNQFIAQLTNRVNALGSGPGATTFPKGVDLQGSTLSNLNAVGPQHTALSAAQVEAGYGPATMSRKLDAGGSHALRGVRQLNNNSQQENSSVFLEPIMNTVPTTNTASISGSNGTVTVSSGYHQLPSGKQIAFAARTDSLPVPTTTALTSESRSGGIVTANASSAIPFAAGSVQSVQGVADSSFNGQFVIRSVSGSSFTYAQGATNGVSTGGTVGGGSVFYYYLAKNQKTLSLAGPYTADTQQNRLVVNKDGSVLIAVAFIGPGGFDSTQSAAGTTPPAATNNVRLLTRL